MIPGVGRPTRQGQPTVVVGAGLAGTMLAIMLARRGVRVELFERRADPRDQPPDLRRSINLALSERGSRALAKVDLLERVQARSVPMRARAIHSVQGHVVYQRFGRYDHEFLRAIERHTLNAILLEAAEAAGVTLFFGNEIVGLEPDGVVAQFRDSGSGVVNVVRCERVIAADGARSATREVLIDHGLARFDVDELPYGYKELPVPREHAGAMELEYLHLWPRRSFMMIANPNPDRSFSCTLFLPDRGADESFAGLTTAEAVRSFFDREFADVVPLMPQLTDEFMGRPTGRMPTVRGGPWHVGDRVLLIGDAAHAIVPFFAQGMNSAFEDCSILIDLLDSSGGDWEYVMAAFYEGRRGNTDAIADMAMQNYHEIREHVIDERFRLRKQVEQELMARFPRLYTSMHVSVMFTNEPYQDAYTSSMAQASLLERICDGVSQFEDVDWTLAERLLRELEHPTASR
jgi:kynurenine 3-monooxygenase